MAIQNRRGNYSALDTSKLVEGEWAFVLSGDEHAEDGKAVYAAFAPSDVKRMATYEDMEDQVAEAMEAMAVPRGGTAGQMLIKNSAEDYDLSWGALTSGVASFNGRSGSVSPAAGDYSSSMIEHDSSNVGAVLNDHNSSINAIEASLSDMFIAQTVTLEDNVSIAANATYAKTYDIDCPSGYRILTATFRSEAASTSGSIPGNIYCYFLSPLASTLQIRVKNVAQSAAAKVKFTSNVVFAKSSLF